MHKILIIDDDESIRLPLSHLLTHNGYEVAEAKNADIGIELFTAFNPDLTLMDISMPVINGFTAAEEIRKLNPQAHILYLSSLSDSTLITQAMKFHAVDFITKPIEANAMLDEIKSFFIQLYNRSTIKKILVVDDESIIQQSMQRILTDHDMELFFANNGKEGVDAYSKYKPDLVFMDIMMPVMDGLQASEHILNLDPNARVVFLTGFADMSNIIQAKHIGIKSVIDKPINPDLILQSISILNKYQL